MKAVEGNLQTLASCFDVSLLACPAKKESFGPHCLRQCSQLRNLTRGKVPLRYFLGSDISPNKFHVNTQIAPYCKGQKCPALGVGYIELDRLRWVFYAQAW